MSRVLLHDGFTGSDWGPEPESPGHPAELPRPWHLGHATFGCTNDRLRVPAVFPLALADGRVKAAGECQLVRGHLSLRRSTSALSLRDHCRESPPPAGHLFMPIPRTRSKPI